MDNVKIKVKKLKPEAVLPQKAHENDAGYDLVAIDDGVVSNDGYIQYDTGIAIEISEGYHTEIFPRSSISKYDLILANGIGLVDEGYRGSLLVRFKHVSGFGKNLSKNDWIETRTYKKGDKIAQLVVRKTIQSSLMEVSDLGDSSRGSGGFGSTDKK